MKKIKAYLLILPLLFISACGSSEGTANGSEASGGSASREITDNTVNTTKNEVQEVKPIEYEIDPTKPVIALTFDDGPNTTTTNQVLDLLEKYQVRASFFLIGNNINEESAKTVKRAYNMGCEIDNHSKTHSYMNQMTAEDIAAEVKFVSDKVKEITGEPTVFFRPPYIAVNDTMYDSIDMPFICGEGCNDWDDKISVERRLNRLNRTIKDGVIILLHDAEGNDKTVELLDTLIPQLLEEGYQFATVSELFKAKGVEISGDDTNLYTLLGSE